jgi:Protein of unknown function (DUF3592)
MRKLIIIAAVVIWVFLLTTVWDGFRPAIYLPFATERTSAVVSTSAVANEIRSRRGGTAVVPTWRFQASYSVRNEQYVTSTYDPERWFDTAEADGMSVRYPIGAAVVVSYLRDRPSVAWVHASLPTGRAFVTVVLTGLIFGMLAITSPRYRPAERRVLLKFSKISLFSWRSPPSRFEREKKEDDASHDVIETRSQKTHLTGDRKP